jgi:predicted nucleic acid-binding protein
VALTVLDASIVIAVLEASDSNHEASAAALRRAIDGRDRLVLPVSGYAEVLVGAYQRGPEAVATVDAFLAALPCDVQPADRVIARSAARLRVDHGRGLRLPDALLVATAIELSADRILTADRGWPAIAEILVEIVGPS